MAEDTVLRMKRRFKAPREKVFRAFTELDLLKQWWGVPGHALVNAEMDPKPGGGYCFAWRTPEGEAHPLTGTYREIRPFERLVYTWVWGWGDMAGVETLVTLDFHDLGDTTEIELSHALPNATARDRHGWGWNGAFGRLDQLLQET
jgi:uncharacterized protein YndB with AHSA1/START domain